MINKAVYFAGVFSAAMFFISAGFCEGMDKTDEKEELVAYLKEVSSIVANADIAIRGIGFNALPVKECARSMDTYIGQMELIKYPEAMSKQYRMILLSFKKIRAGFLLLSPGKKDKAVELIRNGAGLLKYAAKDILAVAEKEGLRKSKDRPE